MQLSLKMFVDLLWSETIKKASVAENNSVRVAKTVLKAERLKGATS